ncbi:hypothetical protein [Streptomyces aquilus]|uniref:hypothetical protein n=1 Tax=Streptomyces aquilus TaxID=2548456 RepID=UPI0036966DC3
MADHADETRNAPSHWGYGTERLPKTLDELAGPRVGSVELRLGLYRIVLNNGARDDFVRYLNREYLIRHWPILRKTLGRGVRETWEDAFPELRRSDAA